MTTEALQARIAQMETDLAAFIENANRQIAMQQGAIAVLKQLVAEAAGADIDEATES